MGQTTTHSSGPTCKRAAHECIPSKHSPPMVKRSAPENLWRSHRAPLNRKRVIGPSEPSRRPTPDATHDEYDGDDDDDRREDAEASHKHKRQNLGTKPCCAPGLTRSRRDEDPDSGEGCIPTGETPCRKASVEINAIRKPSVASFEGLIEACTQTSSCASPEAPEGTTITRAHGNRTPQASRKMNQQARSKFKLVCKLCSRDDDRRKKLSPRLSRGKTCRTPCNKFDACPLRQVAWLHYPGVPSQAFLVTRGYPRYRRPYRPRQPQCQNYRRRQANQHHAPPLEVLLANLTLRAPPRARPDKTTGDTQSTTRRASNADGRAENTT